jgi:hypothetical protein
MAGARGARFAQLALVNSALGVIVARCGRLSLAVTFEISQGKIAQIDVIADPARLRELDLAILTD